MATEHYRTFMDLGKEAGLMGKDLTKWIKEQQDGLAKKEREERVEQRKYDEEQRQLEDAREEKKRQHELTLKENELAFKKKARMESAEAMATQHASNPTPAAPNAPISSISSLVLKWNEEEPEVWLEEIKTLFENYNTTETERVSVLAKHMEGKAKAALCLLEKRQRGDMVEDSRSS
ncbi:troponin T, skeletal muscle-like [Macrobrachium rosenbergii]|uniref:troponin T, skeletal muscle-like n=1 Tax=Macrobrachium rosenbergii TaxID=79674 RepID=UPI0034D4824E